MAPEEVPTITFCSFWLTQAYLAQGEAEVFFVHLVRHRVEFLFGLVRLAQVVDSETAGRGGGEEVVHGGVDGHLRDGAVLLIVHFEDALP